MKLLAFLILLIISNTVFSQKEIDIVKCEAQFLEKNLLLIASNFNIEASRALTIQCKLWENPIFSADVNAFNPNNKKPFDVGSHGEKAFQIQQVISLGGKRYNQVQYAKVNEQIAEYEFQDLLRNLKYELRKSFYLVYFNNKKIQTTNIQINNVDSLVKAFEVQTQKGNLPLKELVRLESLLLKFKNTRIDLINNNIKEQSNLQLLLNENQIIIPMIIEEKVLEKYLIAEIKDSKSLDSLAFINRPDYQISMKNIEANEWNVKLQKSLAIPNLNLGGSYDQRGGAFNNQINLTVGIPIPLLNRNQGNIKYANVILDQSKIDQELVILTLKIEIAAAVSRWNEAKKNYSEFPLSKINDFDIVYEGVLNNFKKRNISVLEFTDFMESYNEMAIQFDDFEKNIIVTGEELNNTINSTIF